MLNKSESIAKLAEALAKAQGQIEDAVKSEENPAFKTRDKKSKYADLASVREAIRKPFSDNGLSYSQFPSGGGDGACIITILMHSSGEFLSSSFTMPIQQKTAHGVGSALTYARRYALMAVAGIAAEDDDGNEASGKGGSPTEDAPAPPAAPPQAREPAPSATLDKLRAALKQKTSMAEYETWRGTERVDAAIASLSADESRIWSAAVQAFRQRLARPANDAVPDDILMAG